MVDKTDDFGSSEGWTPVNFDVVIANISVDLQVPREASREVTKPCINKYADHISVLVTVSLKRMV